MFGFAFYQGTTVLYISAKFKYLTNLSYEVNAVFSAIVYLSSVLSGVLTQRYINSRTGLLVGVSLYGIGAILTGGDSFSIYTAGLAVFSLGYGFIYTNTFFLLGELYGVDDNRREGSFTLAYMGFNIGSLFGFFLGGFAIQTHLYTQVTSGMGMIFILVVLVWFSKNRSKFNYFFEGIQARNIKIFIVVLISFFVMLWLCLLFATYIQLYLSLICLIMLLSIFGLAIKERHNKVASKNLIILGVLTLITVMYWSFYKMQDNLFLSFIHDHVNRLVLGFTVPTTSLLSVNPVVILAVSPLIGYLWFKTGEKFNSPTHKVAAGMFVMASGFLFLLFAMHFGLPVNILYVIGFLGMISLSEVIFGPGTISMVGQLADEKYQRLLLGLVQLSASVASIFSGQVAIFMHDRFLMPGMNLTSGYVKVFAWIPVILIMGGMVAVITRKLTR